MRIKNTETSYGLASMAFHWISAVIAAGLFSSGMWMTGLSYDHPWYHSAPELHKSFGVILASIILGRLAWKGLTTSPDEIGGKWERTAAKAVHWLLYGLLFSLFASGYLIATGSGSPVSVFGIMEIPSFFKAGQSAELVGEIHESSAYLLASMTALHAGAAFKHHFFDRDRVLLRMLGR